MQQRYGIPNEAVKDMSKMVVPFNKQGVLTPNTYVELKNCN
jgi:hypothetical protein